MAQLRLIRATGFRGARFDLPIDCTDKFRSIAIFGENAAGKSTVTDALEWFVRERVEHLWREDCRQEALRHVRSNENEDSVVEIRFDGENRRGTKSLSSQLKATTAYADGETEELIERLSGDRIILRHNDIVEFLNQTKSNKRTAIASIIGYDEITAFRGVLQQTKNALEKEQGYTGTRGQAQSLQTKMIEAAGEVVATQARFFELANEVAKPFKLKISIADKISFKAALAELRGMGNDAEKIKAAERLKKLRQDCEGLKSDLRKLNEDAKAFSNAYNKLAREREDINKLRLSDFLSKGNLVIKDGVVSDDQCPFCLTPYQLSKLKGEVDARIAAMAQLQEQLDAVRIIKDTLLEQVTEAGRKSKSIAEDYNDLEEFPELAEAATIATTSLRTYYKTVKDSLAVLEVLQPPEDFSETIGAFSKKLEAVSKEAEEAAKKLDLTELEKKVADALAKLQLLDQYVEDYENCQATIGAYEAQIMTMDTMFSDFVKVQNAALQTVLDTISADVGAFYSALHPKEAIDEVRLTMVGEEGVEFQYSFHGTPTHPPQKYLSESHLNSLGVVLFLASARIFNKEARFLVLDDVVTSFDTKHRRRLLRLLKDEFSDWQIIILTHESVWFDLIKREMRESGWLFHEVRADDENGILLDQSPATLRGIIEKKKGEEDVTNDLRKLLEAVLKDICHALEVKVSFRFNDVNERRMAEELLNQLRSTLKAKSTELAKNKIFSDLAGSTFVANLDSHDNSEKIFSEDVELLLEDIEKFASLFICELCERPIRADKEVPGTKAISCRCGKSQIPWKS